MMLSASPWPFLRRVVPFGLLVASGTLAACNPEAPETPPASAGSLTGQGLVGTIRLAVVAPLVPVAQRHADRFERLYSEAHVTLQPTTAREALVALQRGEADAALLDREPTGTEREALAAVGLRATEALVGAGAVVFVTAGDREGVALDDLDAGRVPLVVASRNTGVAGVLAARLGARLRPAATMTTEADVLRYVAGRPDLVGAVSLAASDSLPAGLRVLPLVDGRGVEALPRPRVIFEGRYELVQPLVLVSVRRDDDAQATTALRAGFARFTVGTQGQEDIVRAGLAPASLPERQVVLAPPAAQAAD